ncbi:MAG: redoxin domain-containing protein [Bryobacterales bacterium]|nr:redoxin domain-containing protein [Bryobacterales bacterium]
MGRRTRADRQSVSCLLRILVLTLAIAYTAPAITFSIRGTDGRVHTEQDAAGKPIVLVFVAVGCPVANAAVPELIRVHSQYGKQAALYAVYSEPGIEAAEVAAHAASYALPFPALPDPEQNLARQVAARVTPEAFVVREGKIRYRGRIDDRHESLTRRRVRATRADLAEAVEAVLRGDPVAQPETRAIGCAITYAETGHGKITFAQEVAPVLYKRCAGCHYPGGPGPFALSGYDDAARRAAQIAAVVEQRVMPPWKPEPLPGVHFAGDRRLPDAEIELIAEWVRGGAPRGDPAAEPAPPRFTGGWRLGKPDLAVRLPQPYSIAASGEDHYRCFVLPLDLRETRYVRAMEVRPSNPGVTHHVLVFTDRTGAARKRDAEEDGLGYECFGAPGFLPGGGLGGWTPGTGPIEQPAGAAVPVRPGTDLVLQLHFQPAGKLEQEETEIAFYFTSEPPTRRLMDVALGSREIDIPAGERRYRVTDAFTLPVDVEVTGVIPHAHYLCTEMRGKAILPDGTERLLLWIRDWDFNQQEQYRYAEPVRLPADTRLEMEFFYDNSAENPRNPSVPPRQVLWGPASTDEMAGLHFQVLPVRQEEAAELSQALWGKFMRSVGGRFYRP